MSPIDPRDIALTSEEANRRFVAALAGRVGRSIASPDLGVSTVDQILRALGSGLIAQTFDSSLAQDATQQAQDMINGRATFPAILLPEPAVITGIAYYVLTAGSFTASGLNNKVALYQLNAAGDTIDRLATTNDNGNIWRTAGLIQQPFTAPVTLEAGLYWTAARWQASSVTTPPNLACLTPLNASLANPLIDSAGIQRCWIRDTSDLFASTLISNLSPSGRIYWFGLY